MAMIKIAYFRRATYTCTLPQKYRQPARGRVQHSLGHLQSRTQTGAALQSSQPRSASHNAFSPSGSFRSGNFRSTMNIDRPLDEIVKESRQQHRQEQKKNVNRPKKGGKKGGGANNGASGKTDMDVDVPQKDSPPRASGGIKKKRNRNRRKGRMDVEPIMRKNGKPFLADIDDRRSPEPRRNAKGAKVSVSNLDAGVTQSDISELFETVGALKSARLIVLPGGASSGSAEVVFEQMEDALDAIKRYNNVPLDNRPLKITLSTDSAPIRIARGGRKNRKKGGRGRDFDGRDSPTRSFDDMDDGSFDRFPIDRKPRRQGGGRRGGGGGGRRNGRNFDRRQNQDSDNYQD